MIGRIKKYDCEPNSNRKPKVLFDFSNFVEFDPSLFYIYDALNMGIGL